jgi:ABC-type glycerol-3-phosphate transport system permease component
MKPSSEALFVYRLGTPFLVSVFFKNDLLFGFKPVNITANLLSTILLVFWLRFHLSDWRIRTLLVILRGRAGTGVEHVGIVMAGSLLGILPMLLLYSFGQKYFIRGLARAGLKG